MLSPEEILSNSIAPAQAAINNYGQSKIDLARWQLQKADQAQGENEAQQRAIQLLGLRQQGEEKIAAMNNQAAMSRIRTQLDKLDEGEKAKEILRQAAILGGKLPTRNPGEDNDSYLTRILMARNQFDNDKIAGQANVIQGFDDDIDGLKKQILSIQQSKQPAVDAYINKNLTTEFINQLSMNGQDKLAQKVQKGLTSGMDLMKAATYAGGADLAAQVGQVKRDLAANAFNSLVTPEDRLQIAKVNDQIERTLNSRNQLLALNPDAAAIYLQRKQVQQPTAAPVDTGATQRSNFWDKVKATAPAAVGTQTQSGGADDSNPFFLPTYPQLKPLVLAKNPSAADAPASEQDIIAHTASLYGNDVQDAQQKLAALGVRLGPNGEIIVPQSVRKTTLIRTGPAISDSAMQPLVTNEVLSPAERKRRFDAATVLLKSLTAAQQAQQHLLNPQSVISLSTDAAPDDY